MTDMDCMGVAKNGLSGWVAVLALGFLSMTGSVHSAVDCEAAFARLNDAARFPDFASKLQYWKSLAGQCGNDGLYELLLSELYVSNRSYAEAEVALVGAVKKKTGREKELRYALSDMYFVSGQLDKARVEAQSLVRDYPDWGGGYFSLGLIAVTEKKPQEAIPALKKAGELSGEPQAYAMLAVAHHHADQPRETVAAMKKAVSLDKKTYGHRLGAIATIYALTELAMFEEARQVMAVHQHYRPQSKNDPELSRALDFLNQKEAATNKNK